VLQTVALGWIVLITAVNCATVTATGRLASVLTAVKLSVLVLIGAGAMLLAYGNWGHLTMSAAGGTCSAVDAAARGGVAGFGAAMLGALWAYDGWDNLAPLSGEVRDPQRNIPRAFMMAMFAVGGLYLFVNLAYFYVLTPVQIASVPLSSSVATETVRRFVGSAAVGLIAMALLASSVGALHASVMANSRIPFAMARDGLFFRRLAAVSPATHVPRNALLAQGVWAAVLALSGSYDKLTDYVIFASYILYGLAIASVFVFRRRLPDAPRPYRTWGYPFVPALFVLVTAWLLANTLWTSPKESLAGLGLMICGVPFYFLWARRTT
jgi:APA family basic amino acid/polyamine antiporter